MAKLTTKIAHIVSGDILSKGFNFLLTIYLTRILGADGFGLVTVAMAYLGYALFFGDFGLYTIGSREIAKVKNDRTFSTIEILKARVSLAILVFIFAWFILPIFSSNLDLLTLTRGFLFALFAHAFLIEWYFNGKQKYYINAISRIISTAIYAVCAIIFVKSSSDLQELPIFFVTGFIVSAIILLIIASRDKPFRKEKKSDFSNYKRLMKSASSVGSGLLFAQVVQLLPPIMIGIFLSTSEAGLYGAAYRLIIIGMLLDRLFVQLLIPNLAKQWSENKDRTIENMQHTSRVILSSGAVLALFIAIGSSHLSVFLFGDEFLKSGPIIVSLSLFLFFTFQNTMFSHGLVAIGKDIEFLKATSYGGILAITLIVLSAMYFNAAIVGLAVALGECFIALFCYLRFRKSLSFNFIFPLILTLTLGLLIFFGSTLINIDAVIKAMIGSMILVGTLLVFRVLRIEDLKWLKTIMLK